MQNWQMQLYDTPLWLLKSFGGVLIAGVILVFLLRKTRFINGFLMLTYLCLDKKHILKLSLLLSAILVLILLEVRFRVLNTFFFNGLYTSLEEKSWTSFWLFASMNLVLILARTLNFVCDRYLDQVLQIAWLRSLNQRLLNDWLSYQNYYRMQSIATHSNTPYQVDNVDQTIQLDTHHFILSTSEFVRGIISSVVSTIEFSVVLWGLSGVLRLFGVDIPKAMVFFVFVYVIIATSIALKIGSPLIMLNFIKEKLTGDYRYALVRTKDNAESIAFYQGESQEKQALSERFSNIIQNRWKIVHRTLGVNGFNYGFTESVKIFPLMLQSPRYFQGQLTIGDMYQTMQSFVRLQEALSFFREFYEKFTAYQAQLERLTAFAHQLYHKTPINLPIFSVADEVRLVDVSVQGADGKTLLCGINITLLQGERLLIQGKSGCGKTSLLRVMSGLWVFGSTGAITMPHHDKVMFIPQRPYLPQGTLKSAMSYPACDSTYDDETCLVVLVRCHLSHLADCLAVEDDWIRKLSGGELQRLAFARILLHRPHVVLLDEATSALDSDTERQLYQQLTTTLADSIIVSVAHRDSLAMFHDKVLRL